MAPLWLNNSCSPFTGRDSSCSLGNLASYAINVTSAADVAAGLKFAKKKNIRLTVKNTGHDFIGRSAGGGSLALWTHNLKHISFLDYKSPHYTGPAVRLGAGVQAYEAYEAVATRGLRVTGGFCSTVGIAGGYVQGGGHGPLEGLYGLAADNTLEFEVVTADGRHLTVTPTRHSDLFWALNGGGGGTYAVVLSHTTRVHADGPVAGASLAFNNTDLDTYWAAIEAWHEHLLVLDGIVGFNSVFGISNVAFGISFATLPGSDAAGITAALAPFTNRLDELGVEYTFAATEKPGFYEHYAYYTADLPFGNYPTTLLIGGRLIPRSAARPTNRAALVAALRDVVAPSTDPSAPSYAVNGIASDVTRAAAHAPNAVLPAWRDSLYWLNVVTDSDPDNASAAALRPLQDGLNRRQDRVKAVTPGGGAYMSEATFDNPDWKGDYYGVNYARLLRVKRRHDPDFLFYGPASVGSDHWVVAADGRLCRARRGWDD